MTGPKDPGDERGSPEVDAAGPASMPPQQPEPHPAVYVFDAEALDAPAVTEPAVTEPAVREPLVPGPAKAVAGAALAVAGVTLAIAALFLLGKGEPKGSPTASPPPAKASVTGAPSGTPRSSAAPKSSATAPIVAVPPPPAAVPVVPVSVLNNSRVKGLAARAATRFRAAAWPVSSTGNYRGLVSTTTVYYAKGQQASAQRFATQFGIPRVLPRSALPGLPTSGMTVVLTRAFHA